ncbi:MAG: hypothetical protein GXY76_08825 [Chloroflexi bacterium]|nr:hypothetical protein [Chloroflexota bacterium]
MGEAMQTSNGRLLSKDVQHLDKALAEFRADMKEELRALRGEMKEYGKACNENALEIATLKEQMRQGDKNTSALAAIVSAAFATIGSVISTLVGGKS